MSRVLINGLVLWALNFLGILGGFVLLQSISPAHRFGPQAIFAMGFTYSTYLFWALRTSRFSLWGTRSAVWALLISLACTPVIFIPVHYLITGYLTSFSNITMMWVFQLPVNALTLMTVAAISRKRCAE